MFGRLNRRGPSSPELDDELDEPIFSCLLDMSSSASSLISSISTESCKDLKVDLNDDGKFGLMTVSFCISLMLRAGYWIGGLGLLMGELKGNISKILRSSACKPTLGTGGGTFFVLKPFMRRV
jgi:hypothetical protein